jgi:hypothetical protein
VTDNFVVAADSEARQETSRQCRFKSKQLRSRVVENTRHCVVFLRQELRSDSNAMIGQMDSDEECTRG